MVSGTNMRKWATPVTIGAFALSAISGIMLFFHLNSVLVKVVHEWGSWFLIIAGLCHVIGSWRSFVGYFSKPVARAIMIVFALFLLIITFFLPFGGEQDTRQHGRKPPAAFLSRAMPEASFVTVANIAQHRPDELMKECASKGIVIKDKEETVREIARSNNREVVEILNVIF
jgi:predicted MFS family arabinose efflux permease